MTQTTTARFVTLTLSTSLFLAPASIIALTNRQFRKTHIILPSSIAHPRCFQSPSFHPHRYLTPPTTKITRQFVSSQSRNTSGSGNPRPPNIAITEHFRNKFRVGDYYVWLYKDTRKNNPTSWEKYTIDRHDDGDDDSVVVISMSTKFSQNEEYVTHHRMTVNLTESIAARGNRSDWKLTKFEYWDNEKNEWRVFGCGDNVQAFEEKFNVLLVANDAAVSADLKTRKVKMNGNVVSLVRTKRHFYTDAWYAPSEAGDLSGVAILKYFQEHSFSLVEWGRRCGDWEATAISVEPEV